MGSKPVTVETTKQLSALRQIQAAIAHMHKKEFECAITLAGAAEGQLPESTKEYMFRLLKKVMPGEDHNAFINWMKHSTGPDKATISELEVVVAIARAIHKFVAVYEASCKEFEEFSAWAVANGHMPKPLTEDARPGG